MPTYTPSTPVTGIGRGGDVPNPPTGGGDDGRFSDSNLPDYGARLRRARLGMICAIVTVSMVFVSLTSAYVFRRGLPTFDNAAQAYLHDWGYVQLPWLLLAINTAILLVSSVSMEFARRDITRRAALAPVKAIPGVSLGDERGFPWLGLTILLGFGFLAGQWMAWGELEARGFFVNTNPNASFVYLLTAAHAVHLAGGLIAMLWAAVTQLRRKAIEARRIAIDVTTWYWHFMALLWIYIFALIAIMK